MRLCCRHDPLEASRRPAATRLNGPAGVPPSRCIAVPGGSHGTLNINVAGRAATAPSESASRLWSLTLYRVEIVVAAARESVADASINDTVVVLC